VKLSIVIICWNDLKYIADCLRSVYAEAKTVDFEVIVTDNASTDGSLDFIREHYPKVRIVANGANLGFGPGNNAGFKVAVGEYVFILNPDTTICPNALSRLVAFADRHPEAGAFGCRTLDTDGLVQGSAQPKPTVFGHLLAALWLRWLGRISPKLNAETYAGWDGRDDCEIGFQAGCALLVRRDLLNTLGGFDARFFHQYEDADLCQRVWLSGKSVLFCPDAEIVHIGGAKRGTYPIKVLLETQRSKYKYFHKHYGMKAAVRIRRVSLIDYGLRFAGYRLLRMFKRSEPLDERLKMYRVMLKWHWRLNPVRFIEEGEEPDLGYKPLAHASKLDDKKLADGLNRARSTAP
jgi:N-acetylglucosaminyl-diphospho-decaprenol L-rhamnosyltransferase